MQTLICVACATEMKVIKNGVIVRSNKRWAYRGDKLICLNCHREVVTINTANGFELFGDLVGEEIIKFSTG